MHITLLAVLLLQTSFSSTKPTLTQVLHTTSGAIRGEALISSENKTVIRYLGMPYGKANRFEPPTETKWTEVFDATTEGKPCPQPISLYGVQNLGETSEDCLNLNIYVQADAGSSARLPVMVFISGIFYSFSSVHKLDGVRVAERGTDIIFVSVNYRVGILGFLSSQSSNINGNFGLRDQMAALKWIQRNIERFGGNPNDVTVVGQSSGAVSVGLLLVSPQAQGLFKRAILMSGSPLSPMATVDQSTAALNSRKISEYFKCTNESVIKECLATKSVQDIVNAQQQFNNTPIMVPFGPVIDQHIVPDSPENLFKSKKLTVESVVLGVLEDDGNIFRTPLPGIINKATPIKQGISESALLNVIQTSKWSNVHSSPLVIKYKYTDWNEPTDTMKTSQQLSELYTDSAFTSPAVRLADILAKHGVDTFFYQLKKEAFTNSPRVSLHSSVGHGDDVRELFGQRSLNESMRSVMDVVFDIWMNFVKTGNPSNSSKVSPRWPRYTAPNGHFITIATNITVQSKLLPDRMAFWNKLLPSISLQQLTNTPTPTLMTTTSSHGNAKDCGNKKDTTKALTAVVAVMAIVIIIMLSIIIYQARILSKRQDTSQQDLS